MDKLKPITPVEALSEAGTHIPDEMISVVNELLRQRCTGLGTISLKQDEILDAFLKTYPNPTSRQHVFDNHWMDFEQLYRNHGWSVVYEKPGYCESGDSYFKFTPKKKNE